MNYDRVSVNSPDTVTRSGIPFLMEVHVVRKNVALFSLLGLALVLGPFGAATAQDVSTVTNTTNACIDSTYKLFSPNMAFPTLILIDRRVTFNPTAQCTAGIANSAACARDPGSPMLLIASASSNQIPNNPQCSWNCGPCGTIITDGNIGLPVELMEFSVESEEAAAEKSEPNPDADA